MNISDSHYETFVSKKKKHSKQSNIIKHYCMAPHVDLSRLLFSQHSCANISTSGINTRSKPLTAETSLSLHSMPSNRSVLMMTTKQRSWTMSHHFPLSMFLSCTNTSRRARTAHACSSGPSIYIEMRNMPKSPLCECSGQVSNALPASPILLLSLLAIHCFFFLFLIDWSAS